MVVSEKNRSSTAVYQEYKGIRGFPQLAPSIFAHSVLVINESAAGAMVSIAAFQAVDPGSIPGKCKVSLGNK